MGGKFFKIYETRKNTFCTQITADIIGLEENISNNSSYKKSSTKTQTQDSLRNNNLSTTGLKLPQSYESYHDFESMNSCYMCEFILILLLILQTLLTLKLFYSQITFFEGKLKKKSITSINKEQ